MTGKGRVLIIDDDELIRSMLGRVLKNDGYTVREDAGTDDVAGKIKKWFPDIALLDISLPGRSGIDILQELVNDGCSSQIVMLTADDSAETAVKAMKLGAADYLTKPFNAEEVKIVLQKILERVRLTREVDFLRKVHAEAFDREMVGESRPIVNLRETLQKMAAAGVASLLITGESGTGKEMLARHFHGLLQVAAGGERKPYMAVNCAALPETLLESELFGYEKGSFTDARTDKRGVFELANGGVILLDEIGEMQPSLQGKLLRVIEERRVRHIGGAEDIPLDVTIIATTNRDLAAGVKRGEFRNDLLYRLNSFHLVVPPLRERREDILPLTQYFLAFFARKYKKRGPVTFSPEAERIIAGYDWPGNIREMKNLVERLVVLGSEGEISAGQLPTPMTGEPSMPGPVAEQRFVLPDKGFSLDDLERDLIRQALEKAGGNKTRAAKLLNISYDTLRYQVKKFGLE